MIVIDPIGRSIDTPRPIRPIFTTINKGLSSMDCRERGSHALCVCFTQDTSSMGIARVKQDEVDMYHSIVIEE